MPAQLPVLVVRRRYACRSYEEVVVQVPRAGAMYRGRAADEATVAQVLVSKYADHLPLYRQAQIYPRQGISWIARHWRIGLAAPPGCCGRFTSAC